MKPLIPYVEPTDSSATIIRGVAAALRGAWMQPQTRPASLVRFTGVANRLPVVARIQSVTFVMRDAGIDPAWADNVTTAELAQWVADLYEEDAPPGELYDTILIGAPNGGAGHLAALLRAPLLGQHFLTRYRYRGHPDDVVAYQAFGGGLAEKILAHNADLAIINHYDPVHDRFAIGSINFLRMKLLDLPAAYAAFIGRHLRPGGTLLFVDCHFPWGQYRIGRRHYFQVGGLGGIPDTAWVNGSPQVEEFLSAHHRSAQKSWALPFPWLSAVESEWGALPPFQSAVESFASSHGYRFRVIHGAHPADFSRLAFYAGYQAALTAGQEPAGVLVDCFTQTSPTAALQAGLLPLWLPYNCTDSLDFLRQMAPQFPGHKPVWLAPVPSFAPAWDGTTAQQWLDACGPQAQVSWIGVDPAAYPVDLASLFRFVPDLQAACARISKGTRNAAQRAPFTMADLEALIASMAAQASAEAQAAEKTTEAAGVSE